MQDGRRRQFLALASLTLLAACGASGQAAPPGADIAASAPSTNTTNATATTEPTSTAPLTTTPSTTTTSTTPGTTTTSTTTTTTSTTTTTTSTTTAPTTTIEPLSDPSLPRTNRAFDTLARNNAAVSMTVMRDGVPIFASASGTTIDGAPATSDSPMVVASVSKMVVAFAIAHLQQDGLVDVDAPMPWDAIGITPHPAWLDVTLRELLDHTSGMPVVRESWFTGVGDCADFLPSLVASAPRGHRGRWTYSNGNYCALGRLIEQTTGDNLDEAVQELVFDPLGLDGIHLTTDGLRPGDVPHGYRVERLSRLGGAGVFVVSTDDLAAMLSTTTAADLTTLLPPGLMTDQYGWGHTGTIDGAKACVWVLELGRTVLAATVAGNNPSTGGGVCDRVVPAVAADVGVGNGAAPNRTP